ncbi:hypothetical protein ACFOW1_03820 [Parasediminibacterium paludis]|uniref:Lipoprotein n=1 Tax=Parasediminibacterium paludis TaxID=908966 RepID=A0ABV8PTT6_9BACT
MSANIRVFILMVVISYFVVSCNEAIKSSQHKVLNYDFDFSYNDVFTTCFSIKFTSSDTVYIRQHFATISSDTPRSNTTYFALLQSGDRFKLDSLITYLNFQGLDSSYFESYQDGIDYQFYFNNHSVDKRIRVHSYNAPSELVALKEWIIKKKANLKLYQLDSTINFVSAKDFLSPVVPSPIIKFKRPKV